MTHSASASQKQRYLKKARSMDRAVAYKLFSQSGGFPLSGERQLANYRSFLPTRVRLTLGKECGHSDWQAAF